MQDSGAQVPAIKRVDMHVHVVGNGSRNSGCWVRVRRWHRPLAGLMLREIGLPRGALKADLEELYIERLLKQLRGSSLGVAVILAQDLVYDEQGRAMNDAGSFYVPNDYVLELAKRHPEFLAAVSIHPARPNALEELERCLAAGAVMMKCLPNCQNINCNDRRFTRFWERMAEAGLPLLAHTGGEHTLPVVCREYADPRILALPLECGVNVIAAHCATRSGLFDPEYFHIFTGMTRRFSNLYGDTSAFNVPSSRVRLPTDESASSAARRKAATAAITESAKPRFFERFDASTSEPLICAATCFELATCACGSAVSIAFCTLATFELLLARTSTTLASPASFASVCNCFRGR